MQSVSYFQELPAEECRALLREAELGRVVFMSQSGLTALPVNYRLIDGRIVFHTAPNTLLAQIAHGESVAFQIDEIDLDNAIGWSVLVRGRTQPAPNDILPISWIAEENRNLGVMIIEDNISGRTISGTKR